ncbi:MAG: polysaccharide deacetylase family protein [Nitrospirota bacterium]|nr:polysaccharide deacetylase family protein [Nitrospirota bacterium]
MKVPILLYHALFDKDLNSEKYEINKKDFETQIRYLSDNGFQSFPVDDFFKTDNSGVTEGKGVAITFDDGNYSDYSIAFPILKKYGFTATFFITVNWIGTEKFATWTQLEEMSAAGMSIQSHSLTHPFLSDLSRDDLHKELDGSRKVLESKLSIPVTVLSIPGGFFSRDVLTMAEEVGYKGVCTSVPGLNKLDSLESGFLILNRFVMTRKTSFQDFKAIVSRNQRYVALCRAQHYFKAGIKKVLGNKRYYALWSRYLRKV